MLIIIVIIISYSSRQLHNVHLENTGVMSCDQTTQCHVPQL